MTEKTFLITMDESCLLMSMGVCVYGYDIDKIMKCHGELEARPDWCPLVEVDCTDIAGKQFHVRYRK